MRICRNGESGFGFKFVLSLAIHVCCCVSMLAQKEEWTVNPYNFQYDMSVYANLVVNGDTIENLDTYGFGAFVGDECRGIAVEDSAQGHKWLYLRVRSNTLSGENVTFKIYDRGNDTTYVVPQTLEFENSGLIGTPSSPKLFSFSNIPGDVNGDGRVAVDDVVITINAVLGHASEDFNFVAADMDGDGEVLVNDVVMIINAVLEVESVK